MNVPIDENTLKCMAYDARRAHDLMSRSWFAEHEDALDCSCPLCEVYVSLTALTVFLNDAIRYVKRLREDR